jgi:hypothetical protein
VNLIQPQIGGMIIPIALVVGGAALVLGSMMAPGREWPVPSVGSRWVRAHH